MTIPLNLNSRRKKECFEEDAGSSPTKPFMGTEQPKKRLPTFVEQQGKTSENQQHESYFQNPSNHYGNLKYTYIVEREDGEEISFPSHIIQYTKTEPQISYCENPHYVKGVFQSRKAIFDTANEDRKSTMHSIMNSNFALYQNREFSGRYRKWYASKEVFVGKGIEESENQPVSFATQWETDSEEESVCRDSTDYNMDFLPQPSPSLLNTKLISKVKINKVELPFFDDDDFLTSLVSSHTKVKKEVTLEPTKPETKEFPKEPSVFMSSLENSSEKRAIDSPEIKQMAGESSVFLNRNLEDEKEAINDDKAIGVKQSNSCSRSLETEMLQVGHEVKLEPSESPAHFDRHGEHKSTWKENNDNGNRKRNAPSPDWDQEWRSSRYRPPREGVRGTSPTHRRDPRISHMHIKMEDWEEARKDGDIGDIETAELMALDAKRISLDERLELELGIKVESEMPIVAPTPSPEATVEYFSWSFDAYGMSTSPVKR